MTFANFSPVISQKQGEKKKPRPVPAMKRKPLFTDSRGSLQRRLARHLGTSLLKSTKALIAHNPARPAARTCPSDGSTAIGAQRLRGSRGGAGSRAFSIFFFFPFFDIFISGDEKPRHGRSHLRTSKRCSRVSAVPSVEMFAT